jgi:quercetin dioxygenase-like cupin family protein
MARHVRTPVVITAQGNKPKGIEEFFGRVNTGTHDLSIARMTSPAGWVEPGQAPEFDEYSVVLRGTLRITTRAEVIDVKAGESIFVEKGEWVQYSTPTDEGAEYIAVCVPAFSPQLVHRDEQ